MEILDITAKSKSNMRNGLGCFTSLLKAKRSYFWRLQKIALIFRPNVWWKGRLSCEMDVWKMNVLLTRVFMHLISNPVSTALWKYLLIVSLNICCSILFYPVSSGHQLLSDYSVTSKTLALFLPNGLMSCWLSVVFFFRCVKTYMMRGWVSFLASLGCMCVFFMERHDMVTFF